jgi:subtilase family serine protease
VQPGDPPRWTSGDSGDHTAGGTDLPSKTVEFPADLPFVTGVGGTSVLVGSTPGYDDETGVGTPHGPAFFGAGH